MCGVYLFHEIVATAAGRGRFRREVDRRRRFRHETGAGGAADVEFQRRPRPRRALFLSAGRLVHRPRLARRRCRHRCHRHVRI